MVHNEKDNLKSIIRLLEKSSKFFQIKDIVNNYALDLIQKTLKKQVVGYSIANLTVEVILKELKKEMEEYNEM